MIYRVRFESIQLKQSSLDGNIADEVEGLHCAGCGQPLLLLGWVARLGSEIKVKTNLYSTLNTMVKCVILRRNHGNSGAYKIIYLSILKGSLILYKDIGL